MTLERLKQLAIAYRDPQYTLALILINVCLLVVTAVVVVIGVVVIFYGVPAIKDWRHASTATATVYEAGLRTVTEAAENVKEGSAEIKPTLQELRATEAELRGYVADLRGYTRTSAAEVNARLRTLDTVFISLRGVAEETRLQIRQNGEESAKTLTSVRTAVNDADVLIKNTDREATRLLSAGALIIETANPKLQDLLTHADNVLVTADGTIKAYQPAGANLARITKASADKWDEILNPPPVKGFWPNVKRVLSFTYRPAFDGIRLYYTLQSLPVRITQPIPMRTP